VDTAFYTALKTETHGVGPAAELSATVDSAAACGGPWSPEQQHGGPATALLVFLAEQLAASAAGRTDLVAVRVAAEFLAPVPVAPLTLSARVLRLARSAVLISAELAGAGRDCLQARVWLVPEAPLLPGAKVEGDGESEPEGAEDPSERPALDMNGFPYAEHLEWRVVSGGARRPGPAATWVRPRVPLVADEQLSSLQRMALIADSASGVSSVLDWDGWSFPNVDLEIHLIRPSQDEWVLMEATTELGSGLGLTRSTLSDRAGLLGAGMQTLLIRRRD
jgi:acyl-coenzyme A thioesterase PaaI-like protein